MKGEGRKCTKKRGEKRKEKRRREREWNVNAGRKKLRSDEMEKRSREKLNLGISGGPWEEKGEEN